jgi:hypothetical protein
MLILLIIQALGNGRNAEKTNMLEETDHFSRIGMGDSIVYSHNDYSKLLF